MRLFRSVAVRQAAITAAVVLAAVAVFAVTAWLLVARTAQADTLRTVDTDLAGLVDVAMQGGTAELQRRIGDRLAVVGPGQPPAHYLLLDPAGRPIAGDLLRAPPLDPTRSESGQARVGDEPVLFRATRLRGGATLYVGRSLAPVRALTGELGRRFGWAALAAVLAAMAVGIWTARRMARRVEAVNRTFRRFEGGDHDARVDDAHGSDEFAVLGRHVDAHLAQIAQLLDVQREISNTIAHELRTPLTHLDTRLRRALEREEGAATRDELEAARADIRSIVSLFDALLDIALGEAAEGGKGGVADVSEIAADLADLYAASAEEAGLDFAARIAPAVRMAGERMQITRMLANLLDNAIKFVPAGERVRLTVSEGPVIVVEDSGPGVRAEDRELIFRRFGRSRTGVAGHGLGLALVKVIATRHGLTVRCEDADPGARFVIEPRQGR